MKKEVKQYKVKQLPDAPQPDSLYWVKGDTDSDIRGFITDINGVAYPLKDITGSGGIQSIVNNDGNITITGTDDLVINISPSLLSTINLALQSGDNISELINDVGYLTYSDLPTNLTLYATTANSDISGYTKLVTSIEDNDYDTISIGVVTGIINTTSQQVGSLVSDFNLIEGNPGAINIRTVGEIRRISGTGTAEFYFEVYLRNEVGLETLVGTSNRTPPVSSNSYQQFEVDCIFNNGFWTATDRVVIKYFADRISGGSNPNYEFLFGGTNPVKTLFPVPASLLLDVPIKIDVTEVKDGIENIFLTVNGQGKLSQKEQILQGELIGIKNGVNSIFNTTDPLIPNTERVFVNGQRLKKPDDYNISGQTIIFTFSPQINETLLIDYIKQ